MSHRKRGRRGQTKTAKYKENVFGFRRLCIQRQWGVSHERSHGVM